MSMSSVENGKISHGFAGGTDGLKPDDVDPCLIFHYGIPSGASLLAYNSTKKILAVSTRYIGDSVGNVSVFKVDQEATNIEQMKYRLPFSTSHGESIIFSLKMQLYLSYLDYYTYILMNDPPIGNSNEVAADVAVIHLLPQPSAASKRHHFVLSNSSNNNLFTDSNGEIFMWSIPAPLNSKVVQVTEKDVYAQNGPACKLNLGYKLDRMPIAKLRWSYVDGKASRLYVIQSSEYSSANLLQAVLLNDNIEARIIKLGIHTHESPVYLELAQSKSPPSLPKEIMVKMPFADPSIIVAKVIHESISSEYDLLEKDILPLFPFETTQKDGTSSHSTQFRGLSKAKNLYIMGHDNGAIKFWDVSCPLMRPVLSLAQQSKDDSSVSGVPLTALYCTDDLQIFLRIYKFKSELFAPDTSSLSLQGVSKKGSIIHSIKLLKVNGAVLFINSSQNAKHLAVGSDQGYCRNHLFAKDSSVMALETEKRNMLNTSMIRPKKPSRALFMQILAPRSMYYQLNFVYFLLSEIYTDGQDISGKGSNTSDRSEMIKEGSDNPIPKQQVVVLCSEKVVCCLFGIKTVHRKKKFHFSSFCWASTLESPDSELVLLFSSGKIKIRSLLELSQGNFCERRQTFNFKAKLNSYQVEGDRKHSLSVSLQKDVYSLHC
ncbi:hypothetical protein ACH5RR_011957 [Cinchona calisaya]|uniref:Transducin/WD40 repeat-like superfamily protein n=1 Tax=Cinchona calisaya TaxID=153742 RepID=A0ABD3A6D6_9GENT